MKVRVLKRFRDKHTGEIHEANKEMTISKERYEEILTVGKLVKLVEEIKEESKAAEPKKTTKKATTKKSK